MAQGHRRRCRRQRWSRPALHRPCSLGGWGLAAYETYLAEHPHPATSYAVSMSTYTARAMEAKNV